MPRAYPRMTSPTRTEMSRGYLSQIEKGVFFASLKIVGKLATALDVEPAELLKLPPRRGKQAR
jgi:transcriptional regulator with XRE-family HTH domain